MPIFRKKPVEIEAVLLLEKCFSNDPLAATEAKLEFEEVLNKFTDGAYKDWRWKGGDHRGIIIPTLEGEHLASPGDWIIKGIAGEFYPCKPDIFANSYEEVIYYGE